MVFGLCGATRCSELKNLKIDDVEKQGDLYYVSIHVTKTKVEKSFVIIKQFVPIVEKYISLRRPEITEYSKNFFLNLRNGSMIKQVNKTSTVFQSF